jgi:hypothetical protein
MHAGLARIIHERFCCNRGFAAATSLRPAGSPLGPSPYCTSTHQVLTAPRAGLATRLSDFATNRHEYCGLAQQLQRPTHVRGNFTDNCWRDCSDPRHERRGRKDNPLELILLRCIPRSLLRGASSRCLNTRTGFGSNKLGLVLREKTLRGLSARIRFDKTKMSGRHEQAWIREERNTGGVYPVASIYE